MIGKIPDLFGDDRRELSCSTLCVVGDNADIKYRYQIP
jgi:hypothetical protein